MRVAGDGRKPGESPMGVPEVEKKLVRLGVVGAGEKVVVLRRFLGDSAAAGFSSSDVLADADAAALSLVDSLCSKTRDMMLALDLEDGFISRSVACLEASE